MEHHSFGSDSRAKGHGATKLSRAGAHHQLLQDEHDGRRGHVAVVEENVARFGKSFGGESEALLGRIEDRAASGMNGPEIDRGEIAVLGDSVYLL